MRINPKEIETLSNFSINHYELGEDSTSPSSIEIYQFDIPSIRTNISYSEFLTKRAAAGEIKNFNYFIDSSAIWNVWRGGETLRLAFVGEKGKQNCLRLVKYLREQYSIPFEQIQLNFEDGLFIYTLLNGGEYYGKRQF